MLGSIRGPKQKPYTPGKTHMRLKGFYAKNIKGSKAEYRAQARKEADEQYLKDHPSERIRRKYSYHG